MATRTEQISFPPWQTEHQPAYLSHQNSKTKKNHLRVCIPCPGSKLRNCDTENLDKEEKPEYLFSLMNNLYVWTLWNRQISSTTTTGGSVLRSIACHWRDLGSHIPWVVLENKQKTQKKMHILSEVWYYSVVLLSLIFTCYSCIWFLQKITWLEY